MKVFKEEQRFTKPWLIILLAITFIVITSLLLKEYLSEESDIRAVEIVTIIATFTGTILPIFFLKLITRIDEKGIYYKFFPFHFKFKVIAWNEITKVYVRIYDPIGDYGGWGLKGGALWNSKKGKAINVSGDIGIQLELTNGKKLLLGTQQKTDAESVLKTYQNKLNTNSNNIAL